MEEFVSKFSLVANGLFVRRRIRNRPVLLHSQRIPLHGKRMARRQLKNILEHRTGRNVHPERKNLIHATSVDFSGDAGMSQKGFNFRGEQKTVRSLRVKQRTYASAIAREKHLLLGLVPDGERPLAVEVIEAILAIFPVRVQNDFGIGPRGELMAFLKQFFCQLYVVEDFPVKSYPQPAVDTRHRLSAALQIDDAKAGMGQACATREVQGARVRAPMMQGRNHLPELMRIRSTAVQFQYSRDAAHARSDGTA